MEHLLVWLPDGHRRPVVPYRDRDFFLSRLCSRSSTSPTSPRPSSFPPSLHHAGLSQTPFLLLLLLSLPFPLPLSIAVYLVEHSHSPSHPWLYAASHPPRCPIPLHQTSPRPISHRCMFDAQMRSFLLGPCRQSFRCRRMGSLSSRSHPTIDLPVSLFLPVLRLFSSRVHRCDHLPVHFLGHSLFRVMLLSCHSSTAPPNTPHQH
jgi:hypothetical protein